MNKTLGLQLIIYGLLLAGVSYLVYHMTPGAARTTLIAGLAGGALSLIWGVLAVRGSRRKAFALLTLAAISYVLLSQAVLAWGGGKEGASPGRLASALMIVMLVFSMGMLLKIAYAGAVPDGRQPDSAPTPPTRPGGTGSPGPK